MDPVAGMVDDGELGFREHATDVLMVLRPDIVREASREKECPSLIDALLRGRREVGEPWHVGRQRRQVQGFLEGR